MLLVHCLSLFTTCTRDDTGTERGRDIKMSHLRYLQVALIFQTFGKEGWNPAKIHSETIRALHVSKKYEELEPRGNVSHRHMVWSPLQGFPQAWYQGCCPILSRGSCIIGHEGFDFWQKFVKGVKWTLYLSSSLLLIIAFLFFFMVFLFVVVVFVHVLIHSALFIEPLLFSKPPFGH